jgi:N6-adenosine-specific RNA methylase IME4
MHIDDICALEVPSEEDSVLLLWATYPLLKEGIRVVEAWGFKYKTVAFTWVKTNRDGSIYMGMGRHTRANAEICLLGVKGKGIPRKDAGIYNTQLHVRQHHSKKPDAFRDDITKLYGDVSRLEMFARNEGNRDLFNKNPFDGWDLYGNQTVNNIELEPTANFIEPLAVIGSQI